MGTRSSGNGAVNAYQSGRAQGIAGIQQPGGVFFFLWYHGVRQGRSSLRAARSATTKPVLTASEDAHPYLL